MQPLTVDFIQSLDGFGAAEGWPGFWGMEGPEYLGWMADSPENEHPILMGANTYRLMHGMAQGGANPAPTCSDRSPSTCSRDR